MEVKGDEKEDTDKGDNDNYKECEADDDVEEAEEVMK